MSETNPKILDPVYGSANGRPVELARLFYTTYIGG